MLSKGKKSLNKTRGIKIKQSMFSYTMEWNQKTKTGKNWEIHKHVETTHY